MREAVSGETEFIGVLDQAAISFSSAIRSPRLDAVAIGVTALGSGTVITIFVLSVALLFGLRRKFLQAVHLLAAAGGSALLTSMMKSYFERARPEQLAHLVDVQGYSYPSGHSLSSSAVYFTFAILLFFDFRTSWERTLIIGFSLASIMSIALSRVYLGVHYFSDVIAGVMVGIFWAAILAAVAVYLAIRRKR